MFERLVLRSVALCRGHGLLDGAHLSIDGFHAEANAALAGLRASLALVAAAESAGDDRVSAETSGDEGAGAAGVSAGTRPRLAPVEPRPGQTPKRRSSNQTSVSRTGPDARLRGKPGQRPHLVHRGPVAVDPRARWVVACLGERADGHEGDAAVPLVERARFACPELASIGAEQGFAAERVWARLERRRLEAYVAP